MAKLEMGDPAPLGLLAFAATTALLMFVDTDWVEAEFKEMVWGYAVWYGGIAQLVVGILELLKGNTFGGTAFSTYGCFWLGWAAMWIHYREHTFEGASAWLHGEAVWFATFGVITFGFWLITLRKSMCLIAVFGLLDFTFWLLVFGVFSEGIKILAGYAGLATAIAAGYTAFAEHLAMEWDIHLFGLEPMVQKRRTLGVNVSLDQRVSYDGRSNTLMVDLRDVVVLDKEDVSAINAAIRGKTTAPGHRVNAIVNYHGFQIAPDISAIYMKMVTALHREVYKSVTRIHADIFAETQRVEWFHPEKAELREVEPLARPRQEVSAELGEEASASSGTKKEAHVGEEAPTDLAKGASSAAGSADLVVDETEEEAASNDRTTDTPGDDKEPQLDTPPLDTPPVSNSDTPPVSNSADDHDNSPAESTGGDEEFGESGELGTEPVEQQPAAKDDSPSAPPSGEEPSSAPGEEPVSTPSHPVPYGTMLRARLSSTCGPVQPPCARTKSPTACRGTLVPKCDALPMKSCRGTLVPKQDTLPTQRCRGPFLKQQAQTPSTPILTGATIPAELAKDISFGPSKMDNASGLQACVAGVFKPFSASPQCAPKLSLLNSRSSDEPPATQAEVIHEHTAEVRSSDESKS